MLVCFLIKCSKTLPKFGAFSALQVSPPLGESQALNFPAFLAPGVCLFTDPGTANQLC